MKKIVFSLFFTVMLAGCVSLRQYRDAEVELAVVREEIRLLEDQKDKSVDSLERRASSLSEENARLAREIEEKNRTINALNRDVEVLNVARLEELSKIQSTYNEFVNELKDEVAKGQIEIEQLRDRISVKMLDKVLFNSGESEINQAGRKTLSKLGETLKNLNDKIICVEGHTDNVKISSSLREKYPTNWELSSYRAVNVVRYLHEVVGVNAAYMYAAAYGEHKPIADNSTPQGRSKNRRIEIILLPMDENR